MFHLLLDVSLGTSTFLYVPASPKSWKDTQRLVSTGALTETQANRVHTQPYTSVLLSEARRLGKQIGSNIIFILKQLHTRIMEEKYIWSR